MAVSSPKGCWRRRVPFLVCAALWCSVAQATPVISTTTRFGTSALDQGTAGSCRGPCGVVIDAGSGTTGGSYAPSICAESGAVTIRFDESIKSGAAYTDSSKTLTLTDAFSLLSWEKLDLQNLDVGAGWTASTGDTGALYDNGTGVHGKPIAIKLNDDVIPEGTLGSLSDEQWGWGDVDTIGANRVYVQSLSVTPTIHAIYGDGTHLLLSGTGTSFNCFEVSDKSSDDAVVMVDDITSGGDSSDVVIWQSVNAWTDLEYIWTVSCPNGMGTCIEDITNGDQRPGAATTEIDETRGYGPIWAFVFKEGFGQDAIITLTVNDLTNGGTDTQTIEVDETSWSGSSIKYLSSGGNDSNSGDSTGAAWLTWEKGLEWLDGATAPAELVLVAGETIDHAGTALDQWDAITGDRRIRSTVTGTKATVTIGNNERFIEMVNGNTDLRLMDLTITKTGATDGVVFGGRNSVVLRVDATSNGTVSAFKTGTGGSSSPTYDSVIWDCDFSTTGGGTTAGVYSLFMGGSATPIDISRRAVVGCSLSSEGGEHCLRAYNKNSLWVYNKLYRNINSQKTVMVFYTGSAVPAEYNYFYADWFALGATNTDASAALVMGWESGGDRHENVLIDSCFFEDQRDSSSTTIREALKFNIGDNLLVRNCMFNGYSRNFTSEGNGAITSLRIHNCSFYLDKGTASSIIRTTTSAAQSIANLKFVNNAVHDTSSTSSSNYEIETVGANATLESTQILGTHTEWGSAAGQFRVEGSTYNNTTWAAASMKGAQTNDGNLGTGSDPLFTNPASNDMSLQALSPCIDDAFTLATVKRDYRGYIRPEPGGTLKDVGAYEYGATADGAAPGNGTQGASPALLLGGAE